MDNPTISYKTYLKNKYVSLCKPRLPRISVKKALLNRKSYRVFSQTPLSAQDISTVLYYGLGINPSFHDFKHRFYPSAGGKFPLEGYFFALKTHIACGIYHYNVERHGLEQLSSFPSFNISEYFPQFIKKKPTGLIVLTGMLQRTMEKYGERGRRYIDMEAGHVGQNTQLVCTALNIHTVPIGGGYYPKKIESILGVNSKSEPVIYALALGYDAK